jgi:hypothetical protein
MDGWTMMIYLGCVRLVGYVSADPIADGADMGMVGADAAS